MGKKSSEDYQKGFKEGDKYQRDSNAHPWSIGAGLGSDPPSKRGNEEYNKGVRDGRENVRKGR